jgi:hypothetical protein
MNERTNHQRIMTGGGRERRGKATVSFSAIQDIDAFPAVFRGRETRSLEECMEEKRDIGDVMTRGRK